MGFHSFWLPENHFRGKNSFPAPLLSLAAASTVTNSILLGCASYLLPIRNALLAAEEVAVLDRLCNGRLILGLGRGIQPEVFTAFGIDTADKRKLFAQRLDVMRKAWAGEAIIESAGGKPVFLSPLPLQQPSPPLWVAAIGPKALKQVAGLGLPYLASPMDSLSRLEYNYGSYHDHIAACQLPAISTVPIMRSVFIAENNRRSAAVLDGLVKQLPKPMRETAGPAEDWAIVGSRTFVHDRLQEYREKLKLTHLIVRAGLPGVSSEEQLDSHEALLALEFPQ